MGFNSSVPGRDIVGTAIVGLGFEPDYNLLDARVQHAVIAVVHELVLRDARHPSFARPGNCIFGT